MKTFSLSELEALSNIKAHTFRIWERRYSIVTPGRSQGNFRHYTFSEIQYLLNIALLNRCGFKISHLVNMHPAFIEQQISDLTEQADLQCCSIHNLIVAMYDLDADKFESVLDEGVSRWGIDITLQKIILPFLERVRLFSYKKQVKEIHFAVTSIRRKIIMAIEALKPGMYPTKTALLFLPEGEHYDLLLLYYNYILKSMGIRVWYMGTNVTMDDLISILKLKDPDLLLTYLRPKQIYKMKSSLGMAAEYLQHPVLHVSGPENQKAQYAADDDSKFINYSEVPKHLDSVICDNKKAAVFLVSH